MATLRLTDLVPQIITPIYLIMIIIIIIIIIRSLLVVLPRGGSSPTNALTTVSLQNLKPVLNLKWCIK